MSKRVIICLVGLPASGKSTLCSELIKQATTYDVEHICYDKHITTVDHVTDSSAWNKARQALNQNITNLVSGNKAETCCVRSKVFLLDDNFYYRGMRKEILHIAQRNSCVFGQIVFRVCKELAISANNSRCDTIVTEETIEKMYNLIEYPSEAWERHVLHLAELTSYSESTLSGRIELVSQFIDFICEQSPEKDPAVEKLKREADRDDTLNDVVQQCDILLRKVISQKIKDDRRSGLNVPYGVYSRAKSLFLEGIKTGKISFGDQPVTSEAVSLKFTVIFDDTQAEK